jgi:hypothetical protein
VVSVSDPIDFDDDLLARANGGTDFDDDTPVCADGAADWANVCANFDYGTPSTRTPVPSA